MADRRLPPSGECESIVLTRRELLVSGAILVAGAAAGCGLRGSSPQPLVTIDHAARRYPRRAGDITVNVCGRLDEAVTRAEYRVNDGAWRSIEQAPPRVPAPLFSVELDRGELVAGTNRLFVRAFGGRGREQTIAVEIAYDDSPVILPIEQTWDGELDVGDGVWETIERDGVRRVRPKPGFEDYDRIVLVSGAFADARRVTTEVVFHAAADESRPYGFGVLPLWGGRPDPEGHRPRRGWSFSLAWYYSHYLGVGSEFSHKVGGAEPDWISTYRNISLEPRRPYEIEVEVWPERDDTGGHGGYRQRMRWRGGGDATDGVWFELADREGAPLPVGEYAVALVAHRCQVDFGPVRVEAMTPPEPCTATGSGRAAMVAPRFPL